MSRTSTATGFIAQKQLMTYATPQIEHLQIDGFDRWDVARAAGGLNWEPVLHPVAPVAPYWLGDVIPDVKAVLNKESGRYIATVSDRYELIDHTLLGKVVDAVKGIHDDANITAVVVLDGGRRIGVRITHGEMRLPFDPSPIAMETWIWLRHDAKGSLYLVENAQRIFCTNQLGWLRGGVVSDLRVSHRGDVEQRIELMIGQLIERSDWAKWEKEMTRMYDTPLYNEQWHDFVQQWIPLPVDPEANQTYAMNARDLLNSVFHPYREEFGGTLYSAYQAVTEYEDQYRRAQGQAGQFSRAIQPNPRKGAALTLLRQLVGA